jgi:hypothetical protein
MVAAAGRPGGQLPDVGASVDAAFDFAAQMLADQRDFTRTLMSAGAEAFAAAAQRPGTDGGTEIAEALAVQPAQDADQPGADVGAAGPPASSEPTSPTATDAGDGSTPEAPAPETPAPETRAPRKATAKKTAPATADSAERARPAKKATTKKAAAKNTAAKKTTAAERPGATGTPAKRAARRSGNGS